jgi:hypothetical protein
VSETNTGDDKCGQQSRAEQSDGLLAHLPGLLNSINRAERFGVYPDFEEITVLTNSRFRGLNSAFIAPDWAADRFTID